jgi:hypothetical protein
MSISQVDAQKSRYFSTSVNRPECVLLALASFHQDRPTGVVIPGITDNGYFWANARVNKPLTIAPKVTGLLGKLRRDGFTEFQVICWLKTGKQGKIVSINVRGVRHPSLNSNDAQAYDGLSSEGYGSVRGTVVKAKNFGSNLWIKVLVGQQPSGEDIIEQVFFEKANWFMNPGDPVAMDVKIQDGKLYTSEVWSNPSLIID